MRYLSIVKLWGMSDVVSLMVTRSSCCTSMTAGAKVYFRAAMLNVRVRPGSCARVADRTMPIPVRVSASPSATAGQRHEAGELMAWIHCTKKGADVLPAFWGGRFVGCHCAECRQLR